MSSAYCDASVLVALLFSETGSIAANKLIELDSDRMLVSDLVRGEVVSAISRRLRMRLIDEADARERLAAFGEWLSVFAQVIPTEPTDVRLGVDYVGRFELALKTPDAIHIAAAHNRSAKLVTLDRGMASAARSLGVDVID